MNNNEVNFESVRDLANVLERLGLRLHAKNRISGGESKFLWHLAEIIRASGHLARDFEGGTELDVLFGDGWREGAIPRKDQRKEFLNLLFRKLPGQG